jgi:hypothetical protein
MRDSTLLIFGIAVFSIFLSGVYVYLRLSFEAFSKRVMAKVEVTERTRPMVAEPIGKRQRSM